MKLKKIFIVISFFQIVFQISVSGFNNRGGIQDSTDEKKIQVEVYSGHVISSKISNAHGKHGSNEETVDNIEIKQNFAIGINTRINNTLSNLDLVLDFLYLKEYLPEQTVTLQGYSISQPKSNLDFFIISAGPGYSFKNDGLWQNLNPFVSFSLAILFGNASDVNLLPNYGQGGSSPVTGIGFNAQFGAKYFIKNFVLSLEYRFDYLDSTVEQFRSFTEGLSFIKSSSYIFIGLGYSF